MKSRWVFLAGPILLLLVWQIVCSARLIDPFFLPSPAVTAKALWLLLTSTTGVIDIAMTVWRVFLSFLIAAIIGIPAGLVLGATERLYRGVEFVIDFLRSIPPVAFFPLALIIFGLTDASKVAVAAFGAMLIIIFNTSYGVIHARKSRILAARVMGASPLRIFRSIIIWESLPQTLIGLRNGVSLALVVIVVTEMFIGTNHGIGHRIIDAQIKYDIADMYASIVLTGILGYAFNVLFLALEHRTLAWNKG